jgi:hypothetical protein
MRQLAFLYGFVLPFTSVFALSGWINLPSLICLLVLVVLMIKGIHRLRPFDLVVFATFVIPAVLSAVANLQYALEEKFLSHLLSYIFVFLAFFFVPRELLQIDGAALLKGAVAGLVFSIIFAFSEFTIGFNFGYEVLSSIPRFAGNKYDATFADLLRVRSLVEESGHYALYLGIITPIALIFMSDRLPKVFSRTLIAAVFITTILTFSTSGIVFMMTSAVVASLVTRASIPRKFIRMTGLAVFVLLVYFAVLILFNIDLTDIITDKIGDMNGRLGPFDQSWAYFQNAGTLQIFFGLGPGYYAYRGLEPVISLAALTIFQNGLIGFILYIVLFMAGLKRIGTFDKNQKPLLLFSLLFAFLVYGGISNYWYPWIWLLLGVLSVGPSAFTSSSVQPVPRS